MKRWIKSATSVANSNAKKIAKETFGTWYNDTNEVKIFKQSTGYALKYYASTPAEADRVLDDMIQTAEYFEIPVIKSFTKLGFLGSAHHYVACIVVPAFESKVLANDDLDLPNKIIEGMIWDVDGHTYEVTSISSNGQRCQITESWMAEDIYEDRESVEVYDIKTDENGFEYAELPGYNWKLYSTSCIYCPNQESDYNDDTADYDIEDEEYYTPSASRHDYSPSNPWDAPGMSIRDFI